MSLLVADVGGTNCRFALGEVAPATARPAGRRADPPSPRLVPDSLMRFANRSFPDFASAAQSYLSRQGNPTLTGICIAVAGPVWEGRASLTNHDWDFSEQGLGASLAAPVRLINDLAALGHALPSLGAGSLQSLRAASRPAPNGQALVLGLGTGVNTCGLVIEGARALPIAAEAGHQSLPLPLAQTLEAEGIDPAHFPSCEDLFAGRGLAALHFRRSGQTAAASDLPPAARAQGGAARDTLSLFARLLGLWAQEIALQALPRNGLFLAGSVARGMVDAGMTPLFVETFADPSRLDGVLGSIPLGLITDDMAALWGCLAAAPKPA